MNQRVDAVEEREEVCFVAEAVAVPAMNTTTSKTGESMCTMLGKTDEPIYDLLNKTDEQMAFMSRRIHDPLLIGDADNRSAVSDCGNEFCKRGSHDKKPGNCCENHNDEHRPNHAHVISAAYTQAFP
ncbi:hypothetical protein Bpfe_002550 [Biomphalaria pfeifferi]|uniref:Uncharacterized protein n=1 Tax=Biomphalaria pfeifferi TaxID=112525 RepID=A0AAD8C754_BIOPF|nr:hypothetical protein Bpfe_002550 [Biomphalaria pfeifferi]